MVDGRACSMIIAGGGVWSYMSRQVFPQAPSPTMTNLRRISAICATGLMKGPGSDECRAVAAVMATRAARGRSGCESQVRVV